MKNLRLTILFSFFACQAFSQTWTGLTVPAAGRYDDLFFLNDTLGWTCNSRGDSYKTTNGGQTWELYPVSPLDYLRSIEFMDADTGFCGGLTNQKTLFKTTDGGQTWTNISTKIPNSQGGICGLCCPGGQVVYGCGVWSSPASFIKSMDGGITWEEKDMSDYALGLVDILFINQDIGWVSGRAPLNSGGVILHTIDGGDTWTVVHNTNIPGDYVWKMQRLDDQHWFASIERDYSATAKTNILKSADDGQTWETVLVKNSYSRLQVIGFMTPEYGWTGDDNLFETTDGGQTWHDINGTTIFGDNFNRFVRRSGQKAYITGRSVYRYDAASSPSSEPETPILNSDFHRLSISPNPTKGPVQIDVSLRQKTQVILKIYAFDGKYEEILWTGEQPVGDYHLQADMAHKPGGAYVVYLKTNHGTQYKLVTVAH